MELHVHLCGWENKKLIEAHGNEWRYISEQEMHKHYPNGGYKILADLKKKSKEEPIGKLLCDEHQIHIFPYQASLPSHAKCIGYMAVEDENKEKAFVRVVEYSAKRLWTVLGILLLIFAIALGLWFGSQNQNDEPNLDDASVAYYIEGVKNADPRKITMPSFSKLEMEAGSSHIKAALANIEGNPCYFIFRIVLKDTGEELYRSGLVKPGTAIPEFDLTRTLDVGTYDINIYIDTRAIEDPEAEMNNAVLDVKLEVKEAE